MRACHASTFALLAFLAALGCTPVVEDRTICSTDADCAGGAVCVRSLCVQLLADGGNPDLESDGGTEPTDDAGSDAGADAGSDGGNTGGGGTPDAGTDAGTNPGGWDAGVPYACDCSVSTCASTPCAPGGRCSNGRCVREGTACWIDPTGSAACDEPSCTGFSCGAGRGSCMASGVCVLSSKPGCVVSAQTGAPDCTKAECLGASCGSGNSVCTAQGSCVAPLPPTNETPPSIDGVAVDGEVLTANDGLWAGTSPITYERRWLRCDAMNSCVEVASGSAVYTVGAADVGRTLVVVVKATNSAGPLEARSAATAVVQAAAPVNGSVPTIAAGPVKDGVPLTAAAGTWTGTEPITFTWQWQRCQTETSCEGIAGASASTYTPVSADVGYSLRVNVVATNGSQARVSATSALTAVVAPVALANTSAPSITGELVDGKVLTVQDGQWTGSSPITFERRLRRCSDAGACVDIALASATYTLVAQDVGNTITAFVKATNPAGSLEVQSLPTARVQAAPPANTSKPTISGLAKDGVELTASPGTWTGTPPLSYAWQWQRCQDAAGAMCADIVGAVSSSYTAVSADVGAFLRVSVVASNPSSVQATASSTPTSAVAAIPLVNTTLPVVQGLAIDGEVLSVDNGQWSGTSPITYQYRWQRCDGQGGCTDVAAGSALYTVVPLDVGSTLVAVVTATNHNQTDPVEARSLPTAPVQAIPPENTEPPAISGVAKDQAELTATTGVWSGTEPLTFAWQWQRCETQADAACVNIDGAISSKYTVTSQEVGFFLRVLAVAKNPSGTPVTAPSSYTDTVAAIPMVITSMPTLEASPGATYEDGALLTSTSGTWNGSSPYVVSLQWQRCNVSGGACIDIPDATESSYRLQSGDVDSTVRLQVTATNELGAVSSTSAPTPVIAGVPPVNEAPPLVSGTGAVGETLTAQPGTWSGSTPLEVAYQWQRSADGVSWSEIAGAVGPEHAVEFVDAKMHVRVVVTATNSCISGCSTSNEASPPIGPIPVPAPVVVTPPTIQGTPVIGTPLTADPGTWKYASSFAIEWYRCTAVTPADCYSTGAVGTTYIPATADQGMKLQIEVEAANAGGTTTVSSEPTVAVLLPGASIAISTTPVSGPPLPVPDGAVRAIVRSGSTIYLGGDFTRLGAPVGRGALLSATSGECDVQFSRVGRGNLATADGEEVRAVAPDGSGGWYVGGNFTRVDSAQSMRVAHLHADGALDTTWAPKLDGEVNALLVVDSLVFLGGNFTLVNGIARRSLVGVDLATGAVVTPDFSFDGEVMALATDGVTLFVGGRFQKVGADSRGALAAIELASRTLSAWRMDVPGIVRALAFAGGKLYVGGNFSSVGGVASSSAVALDPVSKTVAFDLQVNGEVRALAANSGGVVVGGDFTTVRGTVPRSGVAAYTASGDLRQLWDPKVAGGCDAEPGACYATSVRTVLWAGTTVYLGGSFLSVNGEPRSHLAAVEASSGVLLPWAPEPDRPVNALGHWSGEIYAGGAFATINSVRRPFAAAIDVPTRKVISWNPHPNGPVHTIALPSESGATGTVYLGGSFNSVNGSTRPYLAAVDAQTGTATSWIPGPNAEVFTSQSFGSSLYVGGAFTAVGGTPRNRLARLDATTGTPLPWNPDANGPVRSLRLGTEGIWAGGGFTTVGGNAAEAIAYLDLDVGTMKLWNAKLGAGATVHQMHFTGTALLAVGDFTSVTSYSMLTRLRAAGFYPSAGSPNSFDPSLSATGRAVVSAGQTVYLGGDFATVGGATPRSLLAAVDSTTGGVTPWDARLQGEASAGRRVTALYTEGDGSLWVGGVFDDAGTRPGINNLAYFTPQPVVPERVLLAGNATLGSSLGVVAIAVPAGTTVSYQWRRCDDVGLACVPITGATTSSYTVTSEDAGKRLRVVVTATNSYGSTRQVSLRSARVTPGTAGPAY